MTPAKTAEKVAPLRRGWTTGACATAAAKSAYHALLTGDFLDPVTIRLPKGETPSFVLAKERLTATKAQAAIVKDAGDDPDVTHLALIEVCVTRTPPGTGISFKAGKGVGRVTKPGLPLAVGEPAINPMPRMMMRAALEELSTQHQVPCDVEIEISVENGEELAKKTWNPRLGILGGLSILGTTGIVVPFSCSAWIHSIHRGIDVARALGLDVVAGSTGSTSESAVQNLLKLPDDALIDMGDFVGGMLKYLRKHPVKTVVIAGGFAKMAKLAAGHMDLHSGRSQVDMNLLADFARARGGREALIDEIGAANTAKQAYDLAAAQDINIATGIATAAKENADKMLSSNSRSHVLIFDREGGLLAQAH